jgi:acetate kinase
MMGTRPGALDPAIIAYLVARGLSLDEVMDDLNRRSGLWGVSGIGRDLRSVLTARKNGDHRAVLAFDMFMHNLGKYLGAYYFLLGGADALVFTGGIGERCPEVRYALFADRPELGVMIDRDANWDADGSRPAQISKSDSRLAVWVIPTDEELMIARKVRGLLERRINP